MTQLDRTLVFNEFVTPVALPSARSVLTADTIATVSGWGTTSVSTTSETRFYDYFLFSNLIFLSRRGQTDQHRMSFFKSKSQLPPMILAILSTTELATMAVSMRTR